MEFHDQHLQFISTHYFHSKTEGDHNYDTIAQIFWLLFGIKLTLFYAMLYLSLIYIIPKLTVILESLSKLDITEEEKFEGITEKDKSQIESKPTVEECITVTLFSVNHEQEHRFDASNETKVHETELLPNSANTKDLGKFYIKVSDKKNRKHPKKQWKLHIISTFFVSVCITIGLFIISIFSMSRLRQYGNEVLKEYQGTTILHSDANFSIAVWIFIIGFAISKIIYELSFSGDGVSFISLTAISITINLIYGVSYHMPYMVLAFVYNPVQSSIIYLVLTIYILCLYLFFWSIESNCFYRFLQYKYLKKKWNRTLEDTNKIFTVLFFMSRIKSLIIILLTVIFIAAVIYTTNIFILILKLGSFNDFQGAQNFLLPLMIGIIYFVVKPFYKKAKKHFDFDNNENTTDTNF